MDETTKQTGVILHMIGYKAKKSENNLWKMRGGSSGFSGGGKSAKKRHTINCCTDNLHKEEKG